MSRETGDASPVGQCSHPEQEYSPVGGTRIRESELEALRNGALELASRIGYPGSGSAEARRNFDREMACYLHSEMNLTPNEASKEGVWQFMCCVLVPELVAWRFKGDKAGGSDARYMGGVRNALGRLWWRAERLGKWGDRNPYDLIRHLNEDEIVQVMERPTLAGSKTVVRALAEHFLHMVQGQDKRATFLRSKRMALMREGAKRLLRTGAVIAFDVLDEAQARSYATIELENAAAAITKQVA